MRNFLYYLYRRGVLLSGVISIFLLFYGLGGVYAQSLEAAIRLTPNESKIIHLNKDAASVIVANPVHASVFLDTPKIVVIVPATPGATSFTVLDRDGNTIMRRDIIVSDRKNKYVRIQRICNGSMEGCVPSSVYYCPDGCYQVFTASPDTKNADVSSTAPIPAAIMADENAGEGQ